MRGGTVAAGTDRCKREFPAAGFHDKWLARLHSTAEFASREFV